MRPSYRIGLIIGVCLMVVLVTIGLLELFTPSVSNIAVGPYSRLLAFGASSGSSGNALLEPGVGPDVEGSNLASQLFDDPTSVAIDTPTATEFVQPTPAPYMDVAALAAELIAPQGTVTAAPDAASPNPAAALSEIPGATGDATDAPSSHSSEPSRQAAPPTAAPEPAATPAPPAAPSDTAAPISVGEPTATAVPPTNPPALPTQPPAPTQPAPAATKEPRPTKVPPPTKVPQPTKEPRPTKVPRP